MLHLKEEISHVPVRLSLRRDVNTIQRHLPHACQEQNQLVAKFLASHSCTRRQSSCCPSTMHNNIAAQIKMKKALISDSHHVDTHKIEGIRPSNSTQKNFLLPSLTQDSLGSHSSTRPRAFPGTACPGPCGSLVPPLPTPNPARKREILSSGPCNPMTRNASLHMLPLRDAVEDTLSSSDQAPQPGIENWRS